MSTTEEQVTEQPVGKDAFAAARASLAAQSTDHGATEVKGNDTPATTPAEDPEKVADQPEETTEEKIDGLLTPEQLAELDPKDRAKAEKWQATLTRKAQDLSARDKEFKEWQTLIDGLKNDPHSTVEQLAQKLGLAITKADQDTTGIPAELKFLEPFFKERDKKIREEVRAELAPVKEGFARMTEEAIASETESTISRFDKEFPGWKKHESKMLEIGKRFVPAGDMTDYDYMKDLHTLATADISEAEKTKKVVEKINKSVANAETRDTGVTDSRVEIALPPPDKRSMRDAYEAAKRGQSWAK